MQDAFSNLVYAPAEDRESITNLPESNYKLADKVVLYVNRLHFKGVDIANLQHKV